MDMEKLKQWLDLTKQYQQDQFWQQVFDQDSFTQAKQAKNDGFEQAFRSRQDLFPICDVYQQDGFLYIESELPGLTEDNVQVTLQQGKVTIKGEYRTIKPSIQYFLKERVSRKFEKEITLPLPVSKTDISHFFQNGLLTIVLPISDDSEERVHIHIDDSEPS